jgi:hypothetical protein
MAPALHFFMKLEDLKRRQKGTTHRGEQAATTLPATGLRRQAAQKWKKAGGVGVTP